MANSLPSGGSDSDDSAVVRRPPRVVTRALSTGDPSTLGSYHKLCCRLFGNGSPSALFFEDKIKKALDGPDEEVLADEWQMLQAVLHMERGNVE